LSSVLNPKASGPTRYLLKETISDNRQYIKAPLYAQSKSREEAFFMKVKIGWNFIFFFALLLGGLYVIYLVIHSL
jgi:hypothetical protein